MHRRNFTHLFLCPSSLPPSLSPSLPPSERLAELMTGALSRALDMLAVDHHKALAVLYVPLPPSLPPVLPFLLELF